MDKQLNEESSPEALGGINSCRSRKSRMQPQKIIKTDNGVVRLENNNLKKIVDEYIKDDHPVAFVTVIGPPQSGKSFITNLIIHLGAKLKDGDGGWLENLMESGEFTGGFRFGSVTSSKKLIDTSASVFSGIYMWPTPFLMEKANGEKVFIWILHYQISENASSPEDDMDGVQNVLGLTCSRILEILTGYEELRVAKSRRLFSSHENAQAPPGNVCDSVVVLYCSEDTKNAPRALIDDDARRWILDLGEIPNMSKEEYESFLNEFKHFNLMRIKRISEPLHDKDGRFIQEAIKRIKKPLKTTVDKLLMEEDEMIPKQISKGQILTVTKIEDFLDNCVNLVNQLNAARGIELTRNVHLKKEKVTEEQLQKELDEFANSSRNDSQNGDAHFRERENVDVSGSSSFLENSVIENDEISKAEVDVASPTGLLETDLDDVIVERGKSFNANVSITAPSANDDREGAGDGDDMSNSFHSEKIQEKSTEKVGSNIVMDVKEETTATFNQMDVSESSKMEVEDCPMTSANSDESFVMVQKSYVENNEESMEVDLTQEEVEHIAQQLAEENKRKEKEERKRLKEEERKRQREEKKRRQKEEEERKLEEQRKQHEADLDVMNDCLPTAISQVKQMVPSQSFFWIDVHANPQNINRYKGIYKHCFRHILDHNYSEFIAPDLWETFCKSVHAACFDDCDSYLSVLFEPVCALNAELGKQLQLYGYFPLETFEKMAAEKATKLMTVDAQVNPKLHESMGLAMRNFLSMYNATNAFVMEAERGTRETIGLRVKNFYNEEMKRYLAEHGAFTRNEFSDIHRELTRRLLDSSRNVANPASAATLPEDAQDWLSNLERELNGAFEGHKESNELKRTMLQKQINKIVSARYEEYVGKMEHILQTNPEGYDQRKLERDHRAFADEQKNLLGIDLRNRIRKTEPTEGHCEALLHQIDQYWPTVVKANEDNFERKRKFLEEERTRKFLQDKEERALARDRRREAVAAEKTTNGTGSRQRSRGMELGPLIFRLSYRYAALGTVVNGKFELLKNRNGEPSTPIVAGITEDGELLYGTDAMVHSSSEDKCWWITDLLGNSHVHSADSQKPRVHFKIGDTRQQYEISFEFLLGYLMRSLKDYAEYQLSGIFSTVVITIPYWFCCAHRIQVRDAAEIAGFSGIHLVSEESTTAYVCVSRQVRANSYGNLLILSENFGIVSALLYSYTGGGNKIIKMLAEFHENSRSSGSKKKGNWIMRQIKRIANYGSSGDDNEKPTELDFDAKVTLVRKVVEKMFAARRISDNHAVPSDVMFLTDSEHVQGAHVEWLKAFNTVVKSNGCGRVSEIGVGVNGSGEVSMYGASILSQISPDKISELVRDLLAHDVLKSFGSQTGRIAISKEEIFFLSNKPKISKDELQKGAKDVKFYQINPIDRKEVCVGRLQLGHSISNTQQGYPTFEIDSEAIITVKEVKCDAIRNNKNSNNKDLTKDYLWSTPDNLKEHQKNDIKGFIDNLMQHSMELQEEMEKARAEAKAKAEENRVLLQAKSALLKVCQDIEQGIKEKKYNFKTEVSAELLRKKVEKARKLVQDESLSAVSVDDMQKEVGVLEKAAAKYSKS